MVLNKVNKELVSHDGSSLASRHVGISGKDGGIVKSVRRSIPRVRI